MAKLISKYNVRRNAAAIFVFVAAAMIFSIHGSAWAQDNALTVKTASGKLRGVARPTGGAKFLGIPYAQPPVGGLRWREPLPVKPWSGVRDANAFSAACMQWADAEGDWNWSFAKAGNEDCLYLNIVTPQWPVKKPLPVMFWIHGGGNEGGTASTPLFNDGTLVDHGVLLVTINYRLGIFGFFAHPGLTRESPHHASGNYGLMDQILALRWVIANIAKFGGDPHNITVFGQSAGALDTSLMMTSLARELPQKAIVESGTPLHTLLTSRVPAEQAGVTFADLMKVPAGEDAVKFLRQVPAEDLLKAVYAQDAQRRPITHPIIDGWVIPRSPAEVFASGQESAIPLMIGSNAIESGSTATPDELRTTIQKAAGDVAPRRWRSTGWPMARKESPTLCTVQRATSGWPIRAIVAQPLLRQRGTARRIIPLTNMSFSASAPEKQKAPDIPPSCRMCLGTTPKPDSLKPLRSLWMRTSSWQMKWRFTGPTSPKPAIRIQMGCPHWPGFERGQAFIEFTQDGRITTAAGLRLPQCNLYRQVLAERMKEQQ